MFRTLAEWLDTLMGKRYVVRLSEAERARATELSGDARAPAQVRTRAAILLAASADLSDLQIATRLTTSVATVQRTRKRFSTEGFAPAIGWSGSPAEPPREESAESPHGEPGGAAVPTDWMSGVLERTGRIEGAVGVALVDYLSGACLGKAGGGDIDLATAAAFNAAVVRAKLVTISDLSLTDNIEDILVTLSTQYHLIRVLPHGRPLFLYVVLDRAVGSLAMARHRLEAIERGLGSEPSGSERP